LWLHGYNVKVKRRQKEEILEIKDKSPSLLNLSEKKYFFTGPMVTWFDKIISKLIV